LTCSSPSCASLDRVRRGSSNGSTLAWMGCFWQPLRAMPDFSS
jgi:hypothetical protein